VAKVSFDLAEAVAAALTAETQAVHRGTYGAPLRVLSDVGRPAILVGCRTN